MIHTQREVSKNIVPELRTFVLKNRVSNFGEKRKVKLSLSNNFLISIH